MKKHILSLIACATFFASNPAFCMWNANQGDDLKDGKRATGPSAQIAYEKQKNDQDFSKAFSEVLKETRGPVSFEYYNLSQLVVPKLLPFFINEKQGAIRGCVDAVTAQDKNHPFNMEKVAKCVPMVPNKVRLVKLDGGFYSSCYASSQDWCNVSECGVYSIERCSKVGVHVMLPLSDSSIRLNFCDLLVHEKTAQTQSYLFHVGALSYTLEAYVVPDPELTRNLTVALGKRFCTLPKQGTPMEMATVELAAETRAIQVSGQKIIFVLKDVPQKPVTQ